MQLLCYVRATFLSFHCKQRNTYRFPICTKLDTIYNIHLVNTRNFYRNEIVQNEIVKFLLALLFKTGGASDTTLHSRVPSRKVLPKKNLAVHKREFFLFYK